MASALHDSSVSDDVLYSRTTDTRNHLPELSIVRLTKAVEADSGVVVVPGFTGTIVAVLGQGEAYLVELVEPEATVVLVDPNGVEPIA